MFEKLRVRLALVNSFVVLALTALLIAGALYSARAALTGPAELAAFFLVETSPAGAVIFASSNSPLAGDSLAKLAGQALRAGGQHGKISLVRGEYLYLKLARENRPDTLIVFRDCARERDMLKTLATALAAVGLVCLPISLAAGLFAAGRALLPLRRSWRQQRNFLADAAHELKTPLAVIQTNLEIVLGSPDEKVSDNGKWLANIREESVAMAKLIDSLLFLARVDAAQQPLEMRRFSFTAAVRQASAPFEPVAAAKGLSLDLHDSAPYIEHHGDESRLKQLVAILLDNAVRHTPAGGAVSLCLSHSDVSVILTVADTGEGIKPEHLDKIFDRFYQAPGARGGGSGLGLAIAKWIVDSHGGKLSVASAPGEGTAFTATFPRPRV